MTSARRGLLLAFLVALAAAGALASTLDHGFVYDDHRFVEWNRHLDSVASAPWTAFDPATTTLDGAEPGMWRPLRTLSLALDRALFGPGPLGHHIASLLLHGLAAALVFALGRALGVMDLGAAAGAAIFAFHPVQVEVVAWISSRGDLLAAVGVLAAVLVHLRRGPSWATAGLAGFAFLAKESAVAAPLLLVVADLAAGGWIRVKERVRGPVVGTAVLLALVAVRGAVLSAAGGTFGQGEGLGLDAGERWAALPAMGGWYAWRTLAPLPGQFDYRLEPSLSWALPFLGGLALLAAAGRPGVPCRVRAPVGLAVLWTVAALAPVTLLQVVFPLKILVADRFLYLGLAGPALALGFLLTLPGPATARVLFVASPALLFATLSSVGSWKGDAELWERVLERSPAHPRALHGLALARETESPVESARLYRSYLEQVPEDAGAWYRYGLTEERLAQAEEEPVIREGRLKSASGAYHTANRLWLEGETDGRERGLPGTRLGRACVLAVLGQDQPAAMEAMDGYSLLEKASPEIRRELEPRLEVLRAWAASRGQAALLERLGGGKPEESPPVVENGNPK